RALIQSISPDYFKTMGIPLLSGRAFDDRDRADSLPVAMVNQVLVRHYFPNENPLGKHVTLGNLKPAEVVGVVADAANQGLAQPVDGEIYTPYSQLASPQLYLSVRTSLDPHSLVSAMRASASQADPDQPLTDIQTMQERMESASASPRFTMLLIGIFSAVAFLLAAVGIYGVIAYSVAQRTQELGIRIALGADRASVLRLVVGGGLVLTLAGIVIGLGGSFALTRLLEQNAMLYRTSATDPLTLAASAALFVAVAVLASFVPARRATNIDPACALRAE
ncbi:MAG TPA: FtsX-like permease family protein, partial [Bryobacteraceae bacterium]|nr:FtsX-like permease family protein [Bryobacteraceae bacterium]